MKTHYQNKQKIEEQRFDEFAKSKGITRYNYTALECSYDVKMLSGSTYIIGETKVRDDYDMSFFNNYGAFLELKKMDGMFEQKERIKREKGIDVELYYFNFASNGLQIFALKNPWDYKFDWKYLPKNNIDKSVKVWKMVAVLKEPVEIIYTK